ncbi:hypothetical protein NNC19_21015 [Clostridium sp. SHJSY1]|uniref:glycan biosynthesis hexose transferase WsfD n=1 Tax=Clostridium sp. SHJSY1 TaxID=2942483 RepID=UPI002876CC4F|nr:hypothetical protein [Clostridium sp. SHJSY1]MDS0528173.1 hypothetical protein [Clostridium sp. SHJSY1]
MKFKEVNKDRFKGLFYFIFAIIAILIIIFVLFRYPQQGVADQGDFDRVMTSSGLSVLDSDKANPDFKRFYNYIVTDYKISWDTLTFLKTLIGSSIGYIILIVSMICKICGSEVFKTQYLAIAYGFIYVVGLALLLKNLNIKSKFKLIFLSAIILLVFLDGNYLIWFNSLYGEPMMISTCILFIISFLNYINYKYVKKGKDKLVLNIVYVFIAAFLFLGSKMQVLSALPFVTILLGKILWDNRKIIKKKTLNKLCILFIVIIIYPIQLNKVNGNISKDTQYNSVFYGVLNGSETPEQDLIDMGLNPDMAVEAGKHSYEDISKYEKYAPRTEITENEFYSKISNGKLAVFYLTHPKRLIEGMEYTASEAYRTGTSLGKCSREDSEKSITELNRFTTWSNFREKYLPNNLWFIVGVYISIIIVSTIILMKNKRNEEVKNKIILLWCVMLIGAIQFPMPFMANGKADTAKQLFLFNFVFDMMLVTSVSWICFKFIDMLRIKK